MTTLLQRSAKSYTSYDLVQDGVVISMGHSKHKFAATGKNADGTRFNQARDLGITEVSDGVFAVADLDKFTAFMSAPTAATVAPTAAYQALQNEGYKEPKFVDNTPYTKGD